MKLIGWILCAAVLIIGSILIFGGNSEKYVPFAQCLTEKGAVFYGSYQCSHCLEQKKELGKGMEYIKYIECGPLGGPQNPVCMEAGVEGYPTWIINKEKLVGKQPLSVLAEKTGCQLPQ